MFNKLTILFALSVLFATTSALPRGQEEGGRCHREGEMRCFGSSFGTCDHGYFVIRQCGPGTACEEHGDSVICNYRHGY
ncbi:hypothetical protein FB45DRAFT_1037192 [Roridomyces roridus]|uniref:Uncharacterized protein n=1 Tax=Roridomyces roridus TaxID=1738132 RepID=A0AAD7B7N7_9AGAR|nr:hypothetical protein FB45DRAFT_1037192 [Roridomyces roridus]